MTDPPPQYVLAAPDAIPPITWGYWVVEGQFLAGAYPGSLDPEEHRLKVKTLLDAGIRTFINLTEPDERGLKGQPFVPYEPTVQELSAGLAAQPECLRFAIRDQWVPPVDRMGFILDTIDDALEGNRPGFVHCWGGVGRTGTVVACWLLRHGLVTKRTVAKVLRRLRNADRERGHRRWPDADEQLSFVQRWPEGR